MADSADFDQVADELYGLPVDEFIAARSGYSKQAREAGDRELADRIRGLAKPNQAAWLVDQLVRQHRQELAPLLDLGASLREATRTLAGDQLRQLSRQQHELVAALVQHARTIGRAHGHKVSEDTARAVSETLHAALVDEVAADFVLAGRLSTPLQRSGFGDTAFEVAVPSLPSPNKAQLALDAAVLARDEARAQSEHTAQEADDAQARVEQLRSELDQARLAATEAEQRRREHDGALRRAERAIEQAERRVK